MLRRPKILTVVPHDDYTLDIELSDHRNLKLDMHQFLNSDAYKKLNELVFFLSVKHDYRIIYWDDMHDMHIDQIIAFATKNLN